MNGKALAQQGLGLAGLLLLQQVMAKVHERAGRAWVVGTKLLAGLLQHFAVQWLRFGELVRAVIGLG